MGLIRTPWTRQPQIAVNVDRNIYGLKGAFLPSTSKLGSGGTNTITQYGIGVSTSSSTCLSSTQKQSVSTPNGTDLTIGILAKLEPAASQGATSTLFSIPNSSSWSAPYAPILFRYFKGVKQFELFVGQADGTYEQVLTAATWTLDAVPVWHWFEVKRLGSSVKFLLDGVLFDTRTATKTPSYGNRIDFGWFGTPTPSSNEGPVGSCAAGYIFDEYIDDTLSIRRNPWQLFAPLSRQIWVGPSAGASLPTLSASTYKPGTLTATGWQPRVTAS